ncbi:MAG: hypothetical protein P8181_07425 [bacterium]
MFDGRPYAALAFLDSLRQTCDDQPLYLLIRARCYQEQVPMDDDDTDYGKEISKPALETLDRCIEVCSRRLDDKDPDPINYFYRGWAWMAKAYVRSMVRSLYTAGREAGRGKKDLERYLEIHPGDPTASGLLGSYLYFADQIPNAFKFLAKLLRLPSGDRELGLELLDAAIQKDSLLETDWRLILYNVYFYFEGRYEDGLAGLRGMSQRHPGYGRTAIPIAVSRVFAPQFAAEHDSIVTETVNRLYSAPHREVDWNALYLIQFFRAYGDRYCSSSSSAEARLRSIIHEAPRHPDWVEPSARLELGKLYASRGDRGAAVEMFEFVKENSSIGRLRDEAETLLDDVEKYADHFDRPPVADFDPWMSFIAKFYLGETLLLSGELQDAFVVYSDLIEPEAPSWYETYQLIASMRLAEIYAANKHYDSAAKFAGYAMNFYHGEYLVDWIIEGRQRYFERLANGQESVPPTLLTSNP